MALEIVVFYYYCCASPQPCQRFTMVVVICYLLSDLLSVLECCKWGLRDGGSSKSEDIRLCLRFLDFPGALLPRKRTKRQKKGRFRLMSLRIFKVIFRNNIVRK